MIWKTMLFMMPAFLALAQPNQRRWIAAVAGGYAWFSPKDLNDFLIRSWSPEIKGGMTLEGSVGYYVIPSTLSLHVAGGFTRGTASGEIPVTRDDPGVLYYAKYAYAVSTIPVGLGAEYHLLGDPIAVNFGAFVDLHFARCSYELESGPENAGYITERTKTAVGFHPFVALEYVVTPLLSFWAGAGYRIVNISDLEGQAGFLPAKMSLDLSGPYVLGGARFHF